MKRIPTKRPSEGMRRWIGQRDQNNTTWLSEEADRCSLANAELGNDANLDWNHGYLSGQAKAYGSVLKKLDEIGG